MKPRTTAAGLEGLRGPRTSKGQLDASAESEGLQRHALQTRGFAGPVYGPQQLEQLTAYRRVGLKGQSAELSTQRGCRAVHRQVSEMSPDPLEGFPLDAQMHAAALVADRVPEHLQRDSAEITDPVPLQFEEWVVTVCGQKDELAAEPEVLDVRTAAAFAACPAPLGLVDLVPLDQFCVGSRRILRCWDRPHHVEEVAVRDVRDRQLLDESSRTLAFAPVHPSDLPRRAAIAKGDSGGEGSRLFTHG